MSDAPIRRATAADAPACTAIVNRWIDQTSWMARNASTEAIEEALRTGLPKREAYVIGDPVAGYLSMEAGIAHIWGLYAAKPGEGHGAALIARAKQGRSFLSLNTHHANKRAQAFYAREGFTPVGDPWRGNDGIDEIRMEWGP